MQFLSVIRLVRPPSLVECCIHLGTRLCCNIVGWPLLSCLLLRCCTGHHPGLVYVGCWMAYQGTVKLELGLYIIALDPAILQLLQPDSMKCSHWLPAVNLGIGHEVLQMMSHECRGGLLLCLHHSQVFTDKQGYGAVHHTLQVAHPWYKPAHGVVLLCVVPLNQLCIAYLNSGAAFFS